MKGLKPTLISILVTGLLAGSAVGVAAQSEGPTDAAYFTGTACCEAEFIGGSVTDVDGDGDQEHRGGVLVDVPVEATDSRISGLMTVVVNDDMADLPPAFVSVESKAYRLVNDGGTWSGTGTSMWGLGEDDELLVSAEMAVLVGDGGYEGLSAVVLFETTDLDSGPTLRGIIFDDEMPPFPDLPSSE